MYTGLFGSHVALVMRRYAPCAFDKFRLTSRNRLRRICSALGNHDIRFVSCSATISNPAKVKKTRIATLRFTDVSLQHMEAILGVQNIHVVSIDGSPSGRKVSQPLLCSFEAKLKWFGRSTSSGTRLSSTRRMLHKVACTPSRRRRKSSDS